nr:hypothetical protein [Tanacetum cinerariifolium]
VILSVLMKHGFLSQKREWGGRGVKEKSGVEPFAPSVTVASGNAAMEVELTIMVDETVVKEKQCFRVNTTGLGSYPPLPTQATSLTGNAPGKSSYANVTGKPSGKKLNICTLFTSGGNTTYGFFLRKRVTYHVVANYVRNTWGKYGVVRSMFNSSTGLFSFQFSFMDGLDAMLENGPWSSYARVMIELRADVELKDNIVVFGYIHKEYPKNTSDGEKTVKQPSQTSRSVSVGPKMGFKPQKEYRPILKNSTANSSGNKKKGMEPTIEVSNSNPFDVLNSVDNDEELGTNGGTINLVNNEATLSGSSFMNVDNSSTGTTPIIDKIEKFEDLLTSGEDEVASVDNDMARSMASERVGFGTQSLLEQWKDSYGNGDYDDDPYDDDMYEGRDLSQ